jgi:hypothetical protein
MKSYFRFVLLKGVKNGKEKFSRKISFLRAGWWIIHCVGIAMVYALGHRKEN